MKNVSFQLDHIKLEGLSFGNANKPVVLATHGWLDNAASFIPLAERLNDYHIVAVDYAGHGLSEPRPKGGHYHFLDNIFDMNALIQQQGWQDVILLGHSMGGILASIYAASFPEHVRALVMVEAFGPLTKGEETSPQQLHDAIKSRHAVASKAVHHPSSFEMAVQARLAAGKMNTASAELLMQRNVKEQNGMFSWRTDPRLRTLSPLRLTENQAKAFLSAITCPTLSILGKQGFTELRDAQEKDAHLIQDFHTAEFEGGHHVHMDSPELVSEAMLAFFNKVLKVG
ncbi:alpha/beta fold hydrolase [Alteromonas sp. a30]|uniref:alpha/beta fold hydrolase n=1 Tax=Alteromonas sp. a30 TaxID=2730917 RepID=UPI002281BE04|nr:alpha/beta hydrolase [Alteromonas sp. a30]MCY7296820.1 alpha/beta hydrolase [Alteromonas sp. a30]